MGILKKMMSTVALLAIASHSSVALGATDGVIGNTSTGTVDINIVKGNAVRISNLQDINFGGTNSTPAQQFIDVCVYSTTGSYDITATSGNGLGNNFRLGNAGLTEFITYDVDFNNVASGTTGTDLNNAVTSNAFTGADQLQDDCGGSVNARMFVQINNGSFNAASSGSYSDTLTLVVSPQ